MTCTRICSTRLGFRPAAQTFAGCARSAVLREWSEGGQAGFPELMVHTGHQFGARRNGFVLFALVLAVTLPQS